MKSVCRWVGLVALIGSGLSPWSAYAERDKPNVLFIAIDDLRPELGCYGNEHILSPHIDQLASGGLLFERAYCAVPVCGASRANLMTGILPTPDRYTIAATHIDEDTPGVTTLPQQFRNAGYTTISNGKICHYSDDATERSWTDKTAWHPPLGSMSALDPKTRATLSKDGRGFILEQPDVPDDAYADGQTVAKTIEDLRRLKESGKPFFLACGLYRPHLPFYAPKKYWDLYDREKIVIADNLERPTEAPKALKSIREYAKYYLGDLEPKTVEWHRAMRHGYYASVSYADQLVGDLLSALKELGLDKNTIIVLWGDHGWQLGEHNFWGKHNTMHRSMRIPLIIKLPQVECGETSEALVETGDLYPTLCELAGLSIPSTVQGKSFLRVLNDPSLNFRDAIYCRFKAGDAVVTEDFAYTSFGQEGEMLFDHRKDPEENVNVANHPEYKETVNKMRSHLERRMAEAANAKLK